MFRISAHDSDAPVNRICYEISYGEGIGGPVCGTSVDQCQVFYGTWKPPAPADSQHEFEFAHTYEKPGKYTAHFTIRSGSGYMPVCGVPNPYSDIVTATVQFEVAA